MFRLGFGFTSFGRRLVTVVTDRFIETSGKPPETETTRRCVVCDQRIEHEANCVTIGSTRVDLCCPHCAESFQRARRIITNLDRPGSTAPQAH